MIGLVLIHISLIWIGIAQYQMSNSWRIGIDEKNKTELVIKGVFSISRNPIFLGMIITFMIVIHNFIILFFIYTHFIIQIQIRLEEDFLEKQHRQEYINYKLKTRRLI
ncbi:MAG: isoprenylcysteine carboxylmethyltransferase family protein [Bacteroidetes bacterium]|nr:isoprenylcysteine carboxylmethyltransferase family protein [Bacteroidota bacterium]